VLVHHHDDVRLFVITELVQTLQRLSQYGHVQLLGLVLLNVMGLLDPHVKGVAPFFQDFVEKAIGRVSQLGIGLNIMSRI
jgi:hypothetical protein